MIRPWKPTQRRLTSTTLPNGVTASERKTHNATRAYATEQRHLEASHDEKSHKTSVLYDDSYYMYSGTLVHTVASQLAVAGRSVLEYSVQDDVVE